MERREFIKTSTYAGLGISLPFFYKSTQTHVLSLSFDDGFKKSFYKIAEIHENYGLQACLNVIASGHLKSFNAEPHWIPQHLLGNFEDWNRLQERGHEIMPHTWEHLNLTEVPFTKAKDNIEKCLSYFEENLERFNPQKAVYNFAYNASNQALDAFVMEKVRAVRTGGWLVLNNTLTNPIPVRETPLILGCWGQGPDFCNQYIGSEINRFLSSQGGWLILNLHGLDDEGWGPISSNYLDRLLKRLIKIDHLAILPTGEVIQQFME